MKNILQYRYLSISVFLISLSFASILFPNIVSAHGYPPYWDYSTTAVHFSPARWPSESAWIPYSYQGVEIKDQRTNDPSNGGTSPQNYVNVSSQCTDQLLPSIAWYFDSTNNVLFFRWRVEQIANTYATGPSAGTYSSTDPWKSAQWTVMIDIDGDGYREFAFHLNGSSGAPLTAIDVVTSIYSNTPSQSLDYVSNPEIYELFHNPAAFVDQSTGIILNFQNMFSPTTSWPNGTTETSWDYGTTRSTNITTPTCNEYYIDYQIPLAMLDASSVGGPTVTADTPISLSFATANSLQNPLQKDVVFDGTYTGTPESCLPFGDTMTLGGGYIRQPVVDWITAEGCSPNPELSAQIRDAISASCGDTLTSVDFYFYYDKNANSITDDAGSSWTLIDPGTVDPANPGKWTFSTWNTTVLDRGQYLIGVQAKDNTVSGNANLTFSYLTTAELPANAPGETNYANPTPSPGVVKAIFNNSCGEFAALTKSVSPAYTSVGANVTFTITVQNNTSAALAITSITDALPLGFSYQDTPAEGGTLTGIVTKPVNNATGSVTWTFSGAGASVSAMTSKTFTFTSKVSSVEGTYTNSASAVTSDPDWTNLTSNSIDIGVGAPQLTIAKTPSAYQAVPGDTLTYTITYSNDSPVNTINVVITDTLPAGLNFVAAGNGGTYDAVTRTITWNIGNLASGEGPYTVSYQVTVDQGAAVRTENTARINGDKPDSTPLTEASATTAIYVPSPLQISKTANKVLVDPRGVSPANQVIYTISYRNTGTTGLTGVTITDITMPGFTYNSCTGGSSCSGTETIADGYGDDDGTCETGEPCTVTWSIGALASGASGSVTMTLTVTNPYTEANPAVNTAIIDTDQTGPFEDSASVVIRDYDCGATKDRYFFHDIDASILPSPWTGAFPGTPLPVTPKRNYANKTAPTSLFATDIIVNITDNSELELAHFYMDPPLDRPAGFSIAGTVDMQAYMSKDAGGKVNIIAYLYDFNPNTGEAVQIGTQAADSGAGIRDNYLLTFSISPTGIVREGNILMWRFTTQRNSTYTGMIGFHYDSSATTGTQAGRAYGDVCFAPLSVTMNKTVDKLEASAGDTLAYTISFTNSGQQDVSGATIADTLPTGVSFTSATLNSTAMTSNCPTPGANQYCASGQVYTFDAHTSGTATAGLLVGGATGTLIVNVTIDNPLDAGITTLTNLARLTNTSTDPVEDSAITDITHTPTPDIFLQKSADMTLLNPNDTVTYTITVVNVGDATANNIIVTDTIPADTYFTYVAGSIAGGNSRSDAAAPVLTWTINTLTSGSSATLSFEMLVASSVDDGVTYKNNKATATEATTAPPDSNTVRVAISANANIAVTKTSNPASGPLDPATTVQYTMVVTSNGGSTATGVVVSDPIPANSSYVVGSLLYDSAVQTDESGDDNAHYDSGANRVVFSPGDMTISPNTSHTLKFSVLLDSSFDSGTTTVTNTVTASATNTASKQASASLEVAAAPVLSITKSAPSLLPYPNTTVTSTAGGGIINVPSTKYISVGDHIFWTAPTATEGIVTAVNSPTQITVSAASVPNNGTSIYSTLKFTLIYTNSGDADATNVKIKDILSSAPQLNYLSASLAPTTSPGFNASGILTWELGTVAPGESFAIQVWTRPTTTGTYVNGAEISSNELTAVPSNITSTQMGAIELSKTTSTANVTNSATGTTATYTMSLRNEFALVATGVYVTDLLPVGFTYASPGAITGGVCQYTPRSKVIGTTAGTYYIAKLNHTAAANNRPTTGANWTTYWDPSVIGGALAWVSGLQYSTPNQPIWNNCTINASGTLTIPFTANIAATVGAGTYQNGVTATSTNMSVLPFDEINTTAEDVTVSIPGDLKIAKTVTLTPGCGVQVGCAITYDITLTNVGTATATGFTVNDVLPASLTYAPPYTATEGAWDGTNWIVGPGASIPSTSSVVTGSDGNPYTCIKRHVAVVQPPDATYWVLGGSNPVVWVSGTTYSSATAKLTIPATINSVATTISNTALITTWTFSGGGTDTNSSNNSSTVSIVPTLITLSSFGAHEENGNVVVEWETSSEVNTVGFFLSRLDEKTGRYIQLNSMLLPSVLTPPIGGSYSLIDQGAVPGKTYTYLLTEAEANGTINTYGPFIVTVSKGRNNKKSLSAAGSLSTIPFITGNSGTDLFTDYIRKAQEMSEQKKERLNISRELRKSVKAQKAKLSGIKIKIPVTKDGLYYFDASRISELMGISYDLVKNLISRNKLALSSQGNEVSYLSAEDSSGLFFYGLHTDSIYTKENIYWLYQGNGTTMQYTNDEGPAPVEQTTFTETVHAEEDKLIGTYPFLDPEADFWFWNQIYSGYSSSDTKNFTIRTDGAADTTSNARLTVNLQGITDTPADPDHHVVVSVNGTPIGEDKWNGSEKRSPAFEFSQQLLNNSDNTVEVKGLLDTGAMWSLFYINSFDLTYQRLYEAKENSLVLKSEDHPTITVYGFTEPDIFVFDITDPNNTSLKTSPAIESDGNGYSVSFIPSSDSTYLTATAEASMTIDDAWADMPSDLVNKHNKADYIIIAPDELIEGAQYLADYRKKKGLKPMIVNVEDIMDEFNYGLSSPKAIKSFLTYAYYNWNRPPKYVVLVGDGSYDYRDNLNYGENLVPTMLVNTPMGLFTSDNILADVNSDHVPEIAIGRLPVLSSEELRNVTDKIMAFERNSSNRILMLADNADSGGNFPADSDELATIFPSTYLTRKIYLSEYPINDARLMLFDKINIGTSIINYFGHAGPSILAAEKLLTINDVAELSNINRPFIMNAMTCMVGQYAFPGVDSLSETLMLKKDGGAAAVWAPSGLAFHFDSKALDEFFFTTALMKNKGVLGSSILSSCRSFYNSGGPSYLLDIYNLQGDPALRLW